MTEKTNSVDTPKPWKRTLACSFMAQVLSILGFSFATPFMPFYIRDLGVEEPAMQSWWAGLTLGATGISLAVFAPIWGSLADRYGRKVMVLRSMLGGSVVLLLISFCRNVNDLLICRFLQGIFAGTISASVALVASVTPSRHSGLALGLIQSAVFVGAACGPLCGGLVADMFGYRATFQIGSVAVLLGGLLIYFGTEENFVPPGAEELPDLKINLRSLLSNKNFIIAIGILLAVRFANTIVNPSFPLVIRDILTGDQSLNIATGTIMALAGLTGAFSACLLGFVGDRVGHKQILIFCSLCSALTASAHAFADSVASMALVHLLFGFTIAGTMPAANSLISLHIDSRHTGKAFGVASAISMTGLAFGPWTGGLLASTLGIRAPFLAAGICQVLVTLLVLSSRFRKTEDALESSI